MKADYLTLLSHPADPTPLCLLQCAEGRTVQSTNGTLQPRAGVDGVLVEYWLEAYKMMAVFIIANKIELLRQQESWL